MAWSRFFRPRLRDNPSSRLGASAPRQAARRHNDPHNITATQRSPGDSMTLGPRLTLFFTILVVLVGCFSPRTLYPQGNTGTLRGQVTDPSGSAVGTATVIVTTPTGGAITANTNREGIYEVKGLAPGQYSMKVIASGFSSFDRPDIDITAGQMQKVDVRLSIETQQEKVTVTDQAAAALDVNPANNAGAI